MSKEIEKELNEQPVPENHPAQEEILTQQRDERRLNITDYLALHKNEYESDVALFFKNKFRHCVKTENDWAVTITEFLTKAVM